MQFCSPQFLKSTDKMIKKNNTEITIIQKKHIFQKLQKPECETN